MNEAKVISYVVGRTGVSETRVRATIRLLEEGATIPFISRYRKEVTGSLNEVEIQSIATALDEALEFEKRKTFILEAIEKQGRLTDDLVRKIEEAKDVTELEDLYLPYKQKRRTRAEIARSKGLEPLAKIIMAQNTADVQSAAGRFVTDGIDAEAAVAGALDIIAEWISENRGVRGMVRNMFAKEAVLTSKVVKGKESEAEKYQNYFDFSQPLRRCASHQILAIRRGEEEGLLKVDIAVDSDRAIDAVSRRVSARRSDASTYVERAAADSYKRLIKPSIENEFAAASKDSADEQAIAVFDQNLRQLLLQSPLGRKRVLAIDPGYRTGCKVVCLDEQGNLLHNDTIYPTPPRSDIAMSAKKLTSMIEAYKIDAIALGNGTASRETEQFLHRLTYQRNMEIFVVSEDGASIYSASKVARDEFPDKDVTVRGAVSIGRRLLDPLAELVKIDPKSIGVGQYQHDVNQTKLKKSLDFVVESCVNSVGVNVNTASKELLTYVSGIGRQLAQNIVEYRRLNGPFMQRRQLLKVPNLGQKAYQQSAGFLRIPNGDNPLDNTAVHPENYDVVARMAADCGCDVASFINTKEKQNLVVLSRYVTETVGMPTLTDIMQEIEKPGRDPRSKAVAWSFTDGITTLADLREGMVVNGIITNMTEFGVFVDVGIKENGLVHVSELANRFVSNPAEVVSLNQHVRVKVIGIDGQRKRIALSLKQVGENE